MCLELVALTFQKELAAGHMFVDVDVDVDVDVGEVAVMVQAYVKVDIELVEAQLLLCDTKKMQLGEVALGRRVTVAVDSSLGDQVEMFGCHERRLAQMMYSFHGHDRWSRGYVLVELVGILTWAERGMPLKEQYQ